MRVVSRDSQPDYRDRNRQVWNVVAAKYTSEVEDQVAALAAGQTTLLEYEIRLLGAAATWIEADALETPDELNGSADLVYTGKGALPWIPALDRWAEVVTRLLRPGGRVLLTEGHPLDWVWDVQASILQIDPESGGYFAQQPIGKRDFPQSAYRRLSSTSQLAAGPIEYQWTTAQIVNALLGAGLVLDRLEEHPQPFWEKFPHVPPDTLQLLPHVLVLLAHNPHGLQ